MSAALVRVWVGSSCLALSLSACFNALPQEKPEEEFAKAAVSASTAAAQTAASAEICRMQSDTNLRLLEEARDLEKRAQAAAARCQVALKKLSKPKPRPIIKRPKTPVPEAAAVEAPVAKGSPASSVATSSAPAGPEFSPSDAPL